MKDDSNLLAYCGLYCGDCAGYSGEIADRAKDLENVIEKYKFELTAKSMFSKELKDYDEFLRKLKFISGLKCSEICREREIGSTNCEIRKCCIGKGFYACYECEDFEICEKFKALEELHKDSCAKNLKAIKEIGLKNWITNGKRLWFGSKVDDEPAKGIII
ncbi:MAG: DUF3795 domain-containing protein [Armatimonadetes bacterium]|nr:DUF3795 domain-containing protein [Armatimonadota bacterium]